MKCKKCHRTVERVKVDEHRYMYKCRHCGATYGSLNSKDEPTSQGNDKANDETDASK